MRRAAGLVLVLAALATGADEKAPDIKEIMKKANSPTGIYSELGKDLQDASPMWEDMREQTQELARLAAALGKGTPPKGDKASWARLTRAYAENARALDRAVARMDRKAARAAYDRMGKAACMACHSAHRKK